jgi:predicted metal-dependent phosphotriesterase family hydrolase
MSYVQTVLGPISPANLGRVLTHEHLQSLVPGPWLSGGTDGGSAGIAASALSGLQDLGFRTVVDLTSYGLAARNVGGLREISALSQLHVIAASAIYVEHLFPEWALEASLEEIEERFVADAVAGVEDTGIRIGILGEQATSIGEITAQEEKCLRAAARASAETGLALSTHTGHGTMALEQIDIIAAEGADLSRVVIGHLDQAELSYVRQVLRSGVTVGFDTFGKQVWEYGRQPEPARMRPGAFTKDAYFLPDSMRLAMVAELVADGFANRIVLSMDLTGREISLNPQTHGQHGYSFLGFVVLPGLQALGVPMDALDQMLVENPARLLALDGTPPSAPERRAETEPAERPRNAPVTRGRPSRVSKLQPVNRSSKPSSRHEVK